MMVATIPSNAVELGDDLRAVHVLCQAYSAEESSPSGDEIMSTIWLLWERHPQDRFCSHAVYESLYAARRTISLKAICM
jgi:hypothetical protein